MSELQRGQTWECNERRAESPDHVWKNNPIGSQYVQFTAVVDHVESDYVELTVTRSNPHIDSPEHGEQIATTRKTLHEKPRWEKQ